MVKLYDYDFRAALDTPEAIAIFMADAFETADAGYIEKALDVVNKSVADRFRARSAKGSVEEGLKVLSELNEYFQTNFSCEISQISQN